MGFSVCQSVTGLFLPFSFSFSISLSEIVWPDQSHPTPQPTPPTKSPNPKLREIRQQRGHRTDHQILTHTPPLPPSLYTSDRRQRVTPSTHTLPLHTSTNSLYTHLHKLPLHAPPQTPSTNQSPPPLIKKKIFLPLNKTGHSFKLSRIVSARPANDGASCTAQYSNCLSRMRQYPTRQCLGQL